METIRRNRKITVITFLLSLLFHASFMLYLLLQKSDYLTPPLPPEEILKREQTRDEEWAETKARASTFGAPVFFEDEPSFAEATADKPQPEKEEITKQEQPETKTLELERNIDIPEPKAITPRITQQHETTTIQPPRPTKQESPVKRQPPRTISQPAQRQLSMPAPKQLPSLAQLTQGFLHQIKDEGKHTIHMLGKKNGLPSDEQMKYERYLQKLNWCLQNSFNINNDRFPPSERTEVDVQVFLALDRSGAVKQLNLVKSSGNRQLDQFVLLVFRDTSSSFPPVPQYLPRDPFTITYTITLNSTENNFRIYRR